MHVSLRDGRSAGLAPTVFVRERFDCRYEGDLTEQSVHFKCRASRSMRYIVHTTAIVTVILLPLPSGDELSLDASHADYYLKSHRKEASIAPP